MLAADFTVVIPMSVIKSRLFHGVLLVSDLAAMSKAKTDRRH
jgi:hypothetical protein